MYSAESMIYDADYVICITDNLADLIYNVTHSHGAIRDPEPAILKYCGKPIGTATFGHWTTDGRECYFTFPNGARKLLKFSLEIKEMVH